MVMTGKTLNIASILLKYNFLCHFLFIGQYFFANIMPAAITTNIIKTNTSTCFIVIYTL